MRKVGLRRKQEGKSDVVPLPSAVLLLGTVIIKASHADVASHSFDVMLVL